MQLRLNTVYQRRKVIGLSVHILSCGELFIWKRKFQLAAKGKDDFGILWIDKTKVSVVVDKAGYPAGAKVELNLIGNH